MRDWPCWEMGEEEPIMLETDRAITPGILREHAANFREREAEQKSDGRFQDAMFSGVIALIMERAADRIGNLETANSQWHQAAKQALETGDTHALRCWCDAADGKL